jgi:hypothetical protein
VCPVVQMMLRLIAEIGPQIIWVFIFITALIAVFILYVGIAMHATLHAQDPRQQEIRYQVFRDLLELFLCWRRR